MSLINLRNLRKLHAFLCPEFVKCNVVKRPARNLKPKPHRWAKYSLWVPSAKYGKQICSKLWFLCTLYNCTILYMLESLLPNYHTKMTVLAIWVSSRLEKRRRLGKALGSRWIKGVSSGEPHSPPPTTSSHAGATNCDQCGQEINIFLWHEVRFKTKLRRWPQSF